MLQRLFDVLSLVFPLNHPLHNQKNGCPQFYSYSCINALTYGWVWHMFILPISKLPNLAIYFKGAF
tara:strand:- start:226 stop:423 length:198 start_codon:yes stop_codon:yes gene_type:complete